MWKKGKNLVVVLLSVGAVFGCSCKPGKNNEDDTLDRGRRLLDEEGRKREKEHEEFLKRMKKEREERDERMKEYEEDRKKREQKLKEKIKKEEEELYKQIAELEEKEKNKAKQNKENNELSKKINDLRDKAVKIIADISGICIALKDFNFNASASYVVNDLYNIPLDQLEVIYTKLLEEKKSLTVKLDGFKADRTKNIEVMKKVSEAFGYLCAEVYTDPFCDPNECKLNTDEYRSKAYNGVASSVGEANKLLKEVEEETARVKGLIEKARDAEKKKEEKRKKEEEKRRKELEEQRKQEEEKKKKENEKKKELGDLTKEGKELIRSIIKDMVDAGLYRCYYYSNYPEVIRNVKFFGVGAPYGGKFACFLLNEDGKHDIFADRLNCVYIYGGLKHYSSDPDACLKKYNNDNEPDYGMFVADVKKAYDEYFKKPENNKFSADAFVLVSRSHLFDPCKDNTIYIKGSPSVCDPDNSNIGHVLRMVWMDYNTYLSKLISGVGINLSDLNSMFENNSPNLIKDCYCSKLGNSSGAAPLLVNNNLPSCVTQFINRGQQCKNLIGSFIDKSVKLKALLRKVNSIK